MLSRCFPCLHGQRRKGDVERGERMERAKLLLGRSSFSSFASPSTMATHAQTIAV